jgi:putative nucleotidyltransferase with HDIG domain
MLNPKLKALANKIRDQKLRKKVIALLEDPSFEVAGEKHSGPSFDVSPAGLRRHHAYSGGYIEHVASTADIALAMCKSVEEVYHGKVNRDTLIAGVLLHDAFKPVTYVANEDGSYSSSRLADYMDHLSIAVSELVRRGFSLDVIHVVCAHYGEYGPIRPRSIEALICHLADLADSRLNGDVLNAAAYLTSRATGTELAGLTSKEAFEIVHSKTVEGWKGVTKKVAEINQRRRRTRLNSRSM